MYPRWPAVCIWDETSTPKGNRMMLSERANVTMADVLAELEDLEPVLNGKLAALATAYKDRKAALRATFIKQRRYLNLLLKELQAEGADDVIDADFEVKDA